MAAGHEGRRLGADAVGPSLPVLRERHDHTGWSDSSARAVLQLMVESVAEMIGFQVAVLSVVLDGELVAMAYTGPEEHRGEVFDNVDPVGVLDPVLERAEQWGRFRFLAAERYDPDDALEGHWVVFDDEPGDGPDAWHPHDVCLGVLTGDDGRMVGVLSVDRPVTGRRPDAAQRRLLERYAAQSERAVITAFERESLVQQVAHAEASRRMIRSASMPGHSSLETVLRSTHRPLVDGFGAAGSWVHVFEPSGGGRGYARTRTGELVDLPVPLVREASRLAPWLWEQQQVLVLADDVTPELAPWVEPTALGEAVSHLQGLGLASALVVPVGVGPECLGFLALSRTKGEPHWSPVETTSALEVGHDLGAALKLARALESERALVRQLQELHDHRSQLIATLSHELRTPLTVISGNLEMLDDRTEGDERHLQAMTRGVSRMRRVVDDLLLLTRVSDPAHPLERGPVDLGDVVREVVELVESAARTKDVALVAEVPAADALLVDGDAEELDRMLGNLVSNAVKYTPAGGRVTASVARVGGHVVVRVSDTGLGISEEDQRGLFRAFYRTHNPDALREPGTGLGLSIAASIIDRHGGTVAVDSRLGEGTTFTVRLPTSTSPQS